MNVLKWNDQYIEQKKKKCWRYDTGFLSCYNIYCGITVVILRHWILFRGNVCVEIACGEISEQLRNHTHTHARTHTCTHARTHARTHTSRRIFTHTHTHTHTHARTQADAYSHTHTHGRTDARARQRLAQPHKVRNKRFAMIIQLACAANANFVCVCQSILCNYSVDCVRTFSNSPHHCQVKEHTHTRTHARERTHIHMRARARAHTHTHTHTCITTHETNL